MKKFKITFWMSFAIGENNEDQIKYSRVVEAKSEKEVLDELAQLKWYYIKDGNGTVMLNKDHISEIHVLEGDF